MSVAMGLVLFAVSAAAALAALTLFAGLSRRGAGPSVFADQPGAAVFIFDDDTLVDASATARALLGAAARQGSAWDRLLSFAGPRFPGLEGQIARLPELGAVTLAASGDEPMVLRAEWRGGLRRITLINANTDPGADAPDALTLRAQEDELHRLRAATDLSPFPMWREGPDGAILWANDRYMALATLAGRCADETDWPPPPLFDAPDRRGRVALVPRGATPMWFELAPTAGPDDRIRMAVPADAAVRAEGALREFIQTLALTFANLPIGLAVFDRERRLQLFNPSLTDLTTLPVEFLSARPTLGGVLDAMRDRRMLPEPRDYRAWRRRIGTVEASAAADPVEELWTLPGGQTYRVTVRPHPEGAIALLIEDISASLSSLRTARTDAALGQAALDAVDEAVAVFHRGGALAQTNAAYRALWSGAEPPADAAAALRGWAALCAPDPVWDEVARRLAPDASAADVFEATVRMRQGLSLRCRIAPSARGARIVAFAPLAARPRAHPEAATGSGARPAARS